MFYVYTKTELGLLGLVNDPEESDMDFIRGTPEGVSTRDTSTNIRGLPIIKPPWGRITAVDLTRGEIAWQIAHGEAPDNIRNHRLLEGVELPRTGWPGRIGVLVTKTLAIAGDSGLHTTESGEVGAMLRAYDKATGEEVGAVYMEAPQSGSPMTYAVDGSQYIVVAGSGGGRTGRLTAFSGSLDVRATPTFSRFASTTQPETAFIVLARARELQAAGKDVIELEIGDSPFATPPNAVEAGVQAIRDGWTHYGPASGLPEFREAASAYVNEEHGLRTTAANIVAGPGAKTFEQLFCEAFVNPDDGVLVFSPHFPTYGPNIARRGGRTCLSTLEASRKFRPNLDDVERFLADDPSPKAIFLNSPA